MDEQLGLTLDDLCRRHPDDRQQEAPRPTLVVIDLNPEDEEDEE